ncbi:C-type lectin domain family 17, member A [Collichthys lucidus]|uniref:C-type lectin domain family 17, member A n=1 Tax=Collichthys lucidus TaxID=240159 RepID=A0A4U5TV16_COLLU|nr:C-type lectin domain family 17, member A [Collichthys lucidus]
MSFLRRVAGLSLRERGRSLAIRQELRVEPLLLRIERSQLRWLGHLVRMPPGRLPGSDVTFFLINKTMTWTEAQNYCRTNYTDLASVRNMTENQKIQDLKGPEDKVWIGLFRDSWKWLDGSDSSFRFWRGGEPNNNYDKETCVAANFDISGKWADWNCDWKREFICYSPPTTKRVIRLRVLKTSAQDLNDPAVNEQMLEQLRQRLKDQGVNPDDVKLSWRKQADGKVFHKEEKKTEKKTKKTEL